MKYYERSLKYTLTPPPEHKIIALFKYYKEFLNLGGKK